MPIDYGTNNVSTSGVLTAVSGNFLNLIVNGTTITGSGTTVSSPGANRLLTSDGSSSGVIGQSNLTFNGSLLSVTGSGTFSNNITASGLVLLDGSNNSGVFLTSISGSTSYIRNGRLGIGTTTPITFLHISGTPVTNNPGIAVHGSAAGNFRTYVGVGGLSDNIPFLGSINGDASASTLGWGLFDRNTEGNFSLRRKSSSTTWNDVFNIERSTGRTGFGTNTPSGTLDIRGNVFVSGSINVFDTASLSYKSGISQTISISTGGGGLIHNLTFVSGILVTYTTA